VQPARIFFILCRSDQPIFQALFKRRQAIFDDLLRSYETSQQNVAALKKTFEAQASKMQELTGNLHFRTPCPLLSLPIWTNCLPYLAAAAHGPELEVAKKRIAELEGQLGEKDEQLGQAATQLETAKAENAKLSKVEVELQSQLQKLTTERTAAAAAHAAELQRLLDARDETEGKLMKERDLAVKRAEELDSQYRDQIRAAQAKYDLSLTCLHRADLAFAGMLLLCSCLALN